MFKNYFIHNELWAKHFQNSLLFCVEEQVIYSHFYCSMFNIQINIRKWQDIEKFLHSAALNAPDKWWNGFKFQPNQL